MSHFAPFSGSYKPDDVHFLLKPIVMEMTPVDLKEELIQSGKMHYSDMLSQEPEPTRWHLDLFTRALDSGAARLAREVSYLARELAVVLAMNPLSGPGQSWCSTGGHAASGSACDGKTVFPLRDQHYPRQGY
ncbi:Cysteine protease StiP [Klebsiella pneumoniae]|nr:Cysteine protease StiP [Klebsiella pneumoniae]